MVPPGAFGGGPWLRNRRLPDDALDRISRARRRGRFRRSLSFLVSGLGEPEGGDPEPGSLTKLFGSLILLV
jgi:hypothetical protein